MTSVLHTFKPKNLDQLSYTSLYDLQKIQSLYSNLDTISFWGIKNEMKILTINDLKLGFGDRINNTVLSIGSKFKDPEESVHSIFNST